MGGGALLVNALPAFLCIDVAANRAINAAADGLFEEASNEQVGRQLMLDKLSEHVFITNYTLCTQ